MGRVTVINCGRALAHRAFLPLASTYALPSAGGVRVFCSAGRTRVGWGGACCRPAPMESFWSAQGEQRLPCPGLLLPPVGGCGRGCGVPGVRARQGKKKTAGVRRRSLFCRITRKKPRRSPCVQIPLSKFTFPGSQRVQGGGMAAYGLQRGSNSWE